MTPIRYLNFNGLLNMGVSDFLVNDTELTSIKNAWIYKIGKLEKVPGYTLATSSQVFDNENVNCLHWYYDNSSRTNYMLAGANTGTSYGLKYRTTGTFTAITTLASMAGAKPCFANYLGKAFMVGWKSGTTFMTNATMNGTTYSTADTDLTSMPQGKYTIRYRDLIYVLNAYTDSTLYPSRAYYCDEPTAGAIGWTTDTRYVEFGYDDGDEITGGCEAYDRLIVFKKRSMWFYDETQRKNVADVGCDSHWSIVKINKIPYWFQRDGIWRLNANLVPQLISEKVKPFLDAMTKTNLEQNVFAVQYGNEYRLYIGDVTVNGDTYNNTWLCFDTLREAWYVRCTYDNCYSACNYSESGNVRAYFGNDDGQVMKFATKQDGIYGDNGNEIDSFFTTRLIDLGQPEDVKFTNKTTIFSRYCNKMKIAARTEQSSVFKEINQPNIRANVEEKNIACSGNRTSYKFYEKSLDKSWQFEGFVIESELKEKQQ